MMWKIVELHLHLHLSKSINYHMHLYVECNQNIPKVNVLNLVTHLNCTLVFDWYVVRCGSNNRCQKDTRLKELGLHTIEE